MDGWNAVDKQIVLDQIVTPSTNQNGPSGLNAQISQDGRTAGPIIQIDGHYPDPFSPVPQMMKVVVTDLVPPGGPVAAHIKSPDVVCFQANVPEISRKHRCRILIMAVGL